MTWLSDKDKDRIQRDRLQGERLEAQALRERQKHRDQLEKLQQAHSLKTQEKIALDQLDRETAIALKLLDHALTPEQQDLEYHDLIRRSDIELQTLEAESEIRDRYAHREHKRQVDFVYQSGMMAITQESARILDEQNKAIAINKQETHSRQLLERQQHLQGLEQAEQAHAQTMERDRLLSALKQQEFTHEEITRLAIRLLARQQGLDESEVSREQVAEWIADFENGG